MLAFLLSIADIGDHEKIVYIYDNFSREMLIFAGNRLAESGIENAEDHVHDIVQNAFLKITRHIKRIDFSRTKRSLRAYVLAIVANEVTAYLCEGARFEAIDPNRVHISDGDFLEHIRIKETYDTVVKEIGKLDEKYSITMLYRYHDGMSVKNIAKLMGVPPKTVYTRLERGKKLLLEALKKYDI